MIRFDVDGFDISLKKSFIASENGCGKPISPTLLGPLRIWKYPNAFRSSKVKNAIAKRMITYVIIIDEKNEKDIQFRVWVIVWV